MRSCLVLSDISTRFHYFWLPIKNISLWLFFCLGFISFFFFSYSYFSDGFVLLSKAFRKQNASQIKAYISYFLSIIISRGFLCIASLEVQIFQCIVWKKQIYIPKIARYFQHYIFGVCAFQLSLTIGLSAFARSFQFSCDGFSEATNVKETHAPCSFSFLILQFSLSHMHGPRIRFESTV